VNPDDGSILSAVAMRTRAWTKLATIPASNPQIKPKFTIDAIITVIIASPSVARSMFLICSIVSSGFAQAPSRW